LNLLGFTLAPESIQPHQLRLCQARRRPQAQEFSAVIHILAEGFAAMKESQLIAEHGNRRMLRIGHTKAENQVRRSLSKGTCTHKSIVGTAF
jgi:hypothetical protein